MFKTGVDDCASCICEDSKIECDFLKCQAFVLTQTTERAGSSFDDYANIRNQLMKHYFSQFSHDRLRSIKNALRCERRRCPQLISRSKIEYDVESLDGKEFAGRTNNTQSKTVFHTTNAEAVNNTPLPQEVKTVGYSIKTAESSEVTISKTFGISAGIAYIFSLSFTFGRTRSETRRSSKESLVNVPSQIVKVDPHTKFNVTYNFYQYEEIDNYFLDFVIGEKSLLIHPDIGGLFPSLIDRKRYLNKFLEENVDFLRKMKYENERDIKVVEKNGKFVLKNLPATRKIINFGVDVVFGKPEPIPESQRNY